MRRKVVVGHMFVSSTSASETMNMGNGKRNKVLKLQLFAFGLSQHSIFDDIPFPQPEVDRISIKSFSNHALT